jgi:hypothetical protein
VGGLAMILERLESRLGFVAAVVGIIVGAIWFDWK